jgi:hypothetical protein
MACVGRARRCGQGGGDGSPVDLDLVQVLVTAPLSTTDDHCFSCSNPPWELLRSGFGIWPGRHSSPRFLRHLPLFSVVDPAMAKVSRFDGRARVAVVLRWGGGGFGGRRTAARTRDPSRRLFKKTASTVCRLDIRERDAPSPGLVMLRPFVGGAGSGEQGCNFTAQRTVSTDMLYMA